jgi:hypothetical protein
MDPGEACVGCHAGGEGPGFAFGGTVYPTAHEPSHCRGADGATRFAGAHVVVTDSAGRSVTAPVNAAGNFYGGSRTTMTAPLRAKVVYMGRERLMAGAVPGGDCNSCHTQMGTTTVAGGVKAPGRILIP